MSQTQEQGQTPGERLAARREAKSARKAAKFTPAAPENEPDEVTQGVVEASHWLDRHQKSFWTGFAVLSVVGVVAASSLMSVDKRNRDAGKELSVALRTALSPLGEPPPDADGFLTYYANAADRAEKSLAQYRSTIEQFPGSTAAKFARLGEANALLTLGKADEAQKAFAEIAADAEVPAVLTQQATEGLGFALEKLEKHAEAAAQFVALGKLDGGAHAAPAAYHQARMLVAQDKPKDAIAILETALAAERDRDEAAAPARYPSIAGDIEVLLTELGAAPEASAKPAAAPTPLGGLAGAPGAAGAKPSSKELQEIVDSLRKQMAEQGASPASAPSPAKDVEGAAKVVAPAEAAKAAEPVKPVEAAKAAKPALAKRDAPAPEAAAKPAAAATPKPAPKPAAPKPAAAKPEVAAAPAAPEAAAKPAPVVAAPAPAPAAEAPVAAPAGDAPQ